MLGLVAEIWPGPIHGARREGVTGAGNTATASSAPPTPAGGLPFARVVEEIGTERAPLRRSTRSRPAVGHGLPLDAERTGDECGSGSRTGRSAER